jgi:hypothetical protein
MEYFDVKIASTGIDNSKEFLPYLKMEGDALRKGTLYVYMNTIKFILIAVNA